jgi:hypothetical protein
MTNGLRFPDVILRSRASAPALDCGQACLTDVRQTANSEQGSFAALLHTNAVRLASGKADSERRTAFPALLPFSAVSLASPAHSP